MGIHERKEREKEHRREEILDAAREVFFRKGLVPATMDEIAERAELSKATLYLYYKSKEDLSLAVAMRGLEILEESFRAALAKALSPVLTLLQFVGALDRFFEKQRDYFRLFAYLQSPQFHSALSPEMRDACLAANHRIWSTVTDVLRRGMKEGVVREDINPTDVAIIAMSTITSLLSRIDSELEQWKAAMGIDLHRTLRLSNRLLFEAVLTDEGRRQLAEEEALAGLQKPTK